MKTTKKTKTGITRKTSVSRAKVRKAVKSVMKQRTETKKKVSLSAIKTRSKMKEKNYVFVYEDRKKNELQRKTHQFYNITEARKFAAKLLANSNMNDLHKIVVRLDEFNDFVNKRSKKGVGGVVKSKKLNLKNYEEGKLNELNNYYDITEFYEYGSNAVYEAIKSKTPKSILKSPEVWCAMFESDGKKYAIIGAGELTSSGKYVLAEITTISKSKKGVGGVKASSLPDIKLSAENKKDLAKIRKICGQHRLLVERFKALEKAGYFVSERPFTVAGTGIGGYMVLKDGTIRVKVSASWSGKNSGNYANCVQI